MLDKVSTVLEGKKSYIVAIALVIYALLGVATHQLTQDAAVTLVLNGLGLGALRSAINTVK